jgi:iron(III) transport system substrate-binding protein
MRSPAFSTASNGLGKFFTLFVVSIAYSLIFLVYGFAQEPPKELVEGAKKEGQVTYWGTNGEVALKVFEPFLKRYGLKLEVFDEVANSIAERMITEAQAGTYTPDIVEISPEWLTFVDGKGLLATDYQWPNVKKWGVKQPLWPKAAFFGAEPRPAIFNTELIGKNDWPKGPVEKALINPKFNGLSALSTSSEEFPMVYAYLWGSAGKLNWERSFSFFKRLVEVTAPKAVRGYTGPQKLLAAGEFGLLHFGLFSRAFRNARDGAPVGVGAIQPLTASPSTLAIAKHAPHPNAARLAAHWITTTEGQEHKSKIGGQLPLDPNAKSAPADYGKKWGITPDKLAFVPMEVLADQSALKKSDDFYRKLLRVRK